MGHEADRDAEAARTARARFRQAAPAAMSVDRVAERWLERGEELLAVRSGATLDRRGRPPGESPSGDLYVTSRRLVLAGATPVSVSLDEIEDAALFGERIVLLVRGGIGVTIHCDRPRLLRVQIAAARAARGRP